MAAVLLTFFGGTPAQAGFPEITLKTFTPGTTVQSLAALKLRPKAEGTSLSGTVAWDGYELTATVHKDKDRIRSARLEGSQNNGLIGMYVGELSEMNMVPALLVSDDLRVNFMRVAAEKGKNAEECAEESMEAMNNWAGDGQRILTLLFLPEKVFKSGCAAYKASSKATLGDILAPHGKDVFYVLTLTRSNDRLAFVIGTLKNAGEYVTNWKN